MTDQIQEKIKKLKAGGYEPVYIWDAVSNEEDPDHAHPFETRLIIIEGEIVIRMNNQSSILKAGDEIEIPREMLHYGRAGNQGCKYIVAERH